MPGWWDNAVVYEIYPRSFQDSDGDGIGDLRGDRLAARPTSSGSASTRSGWRPIYASPQADFGYDVTDHTAVAPEYGTLADFDALLADGARPRHPGPDGPGGLAHLDRAPVVPRAPRLLRLGRRPGAAEQLGRLLRRPDLDPRPRQRPALPALLLPRAARPRLAQSRACARRWPASSASGRERGVDGFRVDAVDRLVKDLGAPRRSAATRAVSAAGPRRTERVST